MKSRPLSSRKLSFETCEGRRMMAASPIGLEVEAMQVVSGTWKTISDSGASGKKSLAPTKDNVGELRQTFHVVEAGQYSFTEFFKAPDLQANSFAYQVDNGPIREVTLPKTSGYKSQMQAVRETLAAGNHTVRLFARENGTRLDKIVFTPEGGTATNNAPVVNAGPDQAKVGTLNATLAGTVSDDGLPVGGTFTAAWAKLSGPGNVTFANSLSPTTGATFSAYGTYVLRLSASDGQKASSDDVTIVLSASGGNVIRRTGVFNSQMLFSNPGNNVTIDLAGATIYGDQNGYGLHTDWPDPVTFGHKSQTDHNAYPSVENAYPLSVKGTSRDITMRGGVVQGQLDPLAPWHIYKGIADGDAVRVEALGNIVVDAIRVDNKEDGFAPRTANDKASDDAHFTLRNAYFTRIHDDAVENDSTKNLIVENSFFQAHTFYSSRGTPNPNAQIQIRNVVAELILQPHEGRISGSTLDLRVNEAGGYPYPDGLGSGALFKLDGGGKDGHILVEDSVFLVPRHSASSNDANALDQPGLTFHNVTVVWLGEGAYPGTIPAGVTITRDRSVFDGAKADFFASHPQFTEGQVVNRTQPL